MRVFYFLMLRETDGCGVEWSWIRISHHGHWTLKQHSSAWPPPGHPSLSPPWAGAGTICWNHRDRAKRSPSQHLFTAVQTCKLCETPYWHLMLQQFTLSVEYKGGPESFKNLTVQIREVWPGRPGYQGLVRCVLTADTVVRHCPSPITVFVLAKYLV